MPLQKVERFTGVTRLAPEHIEKNEMEQAYARRSSNLTACFTTCAANHCPRV